MKMGDWKSTPTGLCALLSVLLLLASPTEVRSERLPIKVYTTADGLGHHFVNRIFPDSRGFLWFCTQEGLSRFDGREIITYGVEQGLPHPMVADILETRNGAYWIGSGRGVYRFDPTKPFKGQKAGPMFTLYRTGETVYTNQPRCLYEDSAGRLWVGTSDGLFVMDNPNGEGEFQFVELNPVWRPTQLMHVHAIIEDAEGAIWVGTSWGLIRLLPDGNTIHFSIQPSGTVDEVTALMLDREGRLWIGHGRAGLIVLMPDPEMAVARPLHAPVPLLAGRKAAYGGSQIRLPFKPGEVSHFTTLHGIGSQILRALIQSANDQIWIGTSGGGLTRFDGKRFRTATTAQGLSNNVIPSLAEDRAGNIWMASESGVMKLTNSGFTAFTRVDGLGPDRIGAIFEDRAGNLCVVTGLWNQYISRFDGEGFTTVQPRLVEGTGWGKGQITLQDRTGDWWVPTGDGLYRYPGVALPEQLARTNPKAIYTKKDGLPSGNIFRLFEDSRGDIWISTVFSPVHAFCRWERTTGAFHILSDAEGLPPNRSATAFCEDGAGNLWIGFYSGGLARYRAGAFTVLGQENGLPEGQIRDLHLDQAGRLWVATSIGGIGLISNPTADRPQLSSLTMGDGLSSNIISSITEDDFGRIYISTSRGIDRFDLETGRIKHYSFSDGLPGATQEVSYRDSQGRLWFGSRDALLQFIPESDSPPAPPQTRISELLIEGDSYPLSSMGEDNLTDLELESNRNHLQISFFGISSSVSDRLKYQYRLDGSDREWSEPTDQRTVILANLSPGVYRFLVRAVNAYGIAGDPPAAISFRILPPIWQRWWFLVLAVLAITAIIYSIYRYRLGQLLEVERVRMRIATDLHDDIGASLSQIALLSEVVRQQGSKNDPQTTERLSKIAHVSRELVDSMSDIVWAINPNRDSVSDLTHRMRRFASDTLSARDIKVRFRAPESDDGIKLGANTRREVFLVFKEAVNNTARHSGCGAVDIQIEASSGWLTLRLCDDGKGFVPASEGDGHGLASMRARAESLGGSLEILSGNGQGTTLTLRCPVGRRSKRRPRRLLLI
ncbi:MAG: histidine kinase [Blastocatellia bacterium]|nr:histidine kinase [Blastocatellia bacterium]